MTIKDQIIGDKPSNSSTLSDVERQRRSRIRQRILKAELDKYGIKFRKIPIDETLYAGFEELASQSAEDVDVNALMFLAMREFLSKHLNKDHKDHLFLLEAATISAHLKMESEGVGSLRPWGERS